MSSLVSEPTGVVRWDIDGTLIRFAAAKSDKHRAAIETAFGTRVEAEMSTVGVT